MIEQSLVHGKMRTGILFLMNLICAFGRLTVRPQNAAVIAGERMSMECRVDEESRVRKWDLFDVTRNTTTVYTHSNEGGELFQKNFLHFGVQMNANGSGILFANSTKMEDAGNYTCIAKVNNKDSKFSAQLIVFESLPVCESNLKKNYSYSMIDGDHIWIQCNLNFRGFWAPSMEWIQHGGGFGPEGKTITDGIEPIISPSQSVTSKLTIAVNSSTIGFYYSCKIYFVNYSNTEAANNVPNFTYTWNSSVIYVSQSSSKSVFAVTSSTTETSSSVDWYLIALPLVAALSIFLILGLALTFARCLCFKKKVSVSRIAKAKSEQRTPGSSVPESLDAENSRPMNYFGADGTENMEVNAMGRQPMPVGLQTEPNIFSVVGEYAFLDHTLSPPIPPRGKNV